MSRSSLAQRVAFITPLLCCLAALPGVLPANAAAAATQGSGRVATETRQLSSFEAVATSGAMDLVVRQGAEQSVQVQADDNLLPLLETVVETGAKGPMLQVRWKRGESIHSRGKVLVTVVTPRLSALASAGSGDTQVQALNTPALQVSISGSGNTRLEGLNTADLGVRISGSGNVGGRGSATTLKVSIAGSGDVSLRELRAEDVSISIAGSGSAEVNAQKTLSASIAGSGDVVYTGEATVKSSVVGSGSVKKR